MKLKLVIASILKFLSDLAILSTDVKRDLTASNRFANRVTMSNIDTIIPTKRTNITTGRVVI